MNFSPVDDFSPSNFNNVTETNQTSCGEFYKLPLSLKINILNHLDLSDISNVYSASKYCEQLLNTSFKQINLIKNLYNSTGNSKSFDIDDFNSISFAENESDVSKIMIKFAEIAVKYDKKFNFQCCFPFQENCLLNIKTVNTNSNTKDVMSEICFFNNKKIQKTNESIFITKYEKLIVISNFPKYDKENLVTIKCALEKIENILPNKSNCIIL